LVALFASVALAGCQPGANSASTDTPAAEGEAPAARASSTRLVDRDVEAPEVFQVTGQGLWDGRPSLGGVWVATPDAINPERVLIRNTKNGKFVIGALFKRERENPGPPIQISSDAAAALGLLAGQPGEVNITALRREEEAPAPAAEGPILDTAETVAAETPAAAPTPAPASAALDTAAVAAAIDKADGTAAPAAAGEAAEAAAETATEAAPKRRWWQRKPKAEADAADTPVTDPAAIEQQAAASGGTAPASPAVTTAPLDPAAAKAPAAPTAKAPAGSAFIQLGIFSVEANADRAAETVKKAGAKATVRSETSNGKPYWSVVAGPASTAAEKEALMKKVKDLGFSDAYFVSR
jgi:cell division septation protein DedD